MNADAANWQARGDPQLTHRMRLRAREPYEPPKGDIEPPKPQDKPPPRDYTMFLVGTMVVAIGLYRVAVGGGWLGIVTFAVLIGIGAWFWQRRKRE